MGYFILAPNVTEKFFFPAQVRTSLNTLKLALYHVAIKTRLCRKAVQVCIIPKHDLTLPHKWFIFFFACDSHMPAKVKKGKGRNTVAAEMLQGPC